jgi:hypothetical protein
MLVEEKSFGGVQNKLLACSNPFEERGLIKLKKWYCDKTPSLSNVPLFAFCTH